MEWYNELGQLLRDSGEAEFYDLHGYASIDSTNEACKRAAAEGASEGWLAAAGEQTAGKGRRGRTWISPKGGAVYFSFLLKPRCPAENAYALTLVMGLSAAQAVNRLTPLEAGIKWPNDIVIGGRKVCGILTEASVTERGLEYAVIGTGINVNNTSFAPEIADRATSLGMELGGRHVPEAGITCEVLRCFHENYRLFLETNDLSALMETYNAMLVSRGREVRVEDPLGPFTGTASGIDRTGCLLVTAEDGSVRRVASGEVSVRGIGGYI